MLDPPIKQSGTEQVETTEGTTVMSELIRRSSGAIRPIKESRELQQQKQRLMDEARLDGVKIDGVAALANHIFERAVDLNEARISLAGGDPITHALLGDIQANAMRQMKKIQNSLYDEWSL
jgi:hypothetical protein